MEIGSVDSLLFQVHSEIMDPTIGQSSRKEGVFHDNFSYSLSKLYVVPLI